MVTNQKVKQNLTFLLLKILPRNLLSKVVGRLVSIRWPQWMAQPLIRSFARYYQIRLDEAELPLENYKSIQELFTRRLKSGSRPIAGAFVHPCDGRITSHGIINRNSILQAKGLEYSLNEFLGESADHFDGGYFITYYLCPTDYHRVHSPCEFSIGRVRAIPGDLWPVNEHSVQKVPRLFSINERVVAIGHDKNMAMVMVGATNVGKIGLAFSNTVLTNTTSKYEEINFHPPKVLRPGEEFGVFYMGSTVVLLFDASYEIDEIQAGPVRMGAELKVRRGLVH